MSLVLEKSDLKSEIVCRELLNNKGKIRDLIEIFFLIYKTQSIKLITVFRACLGI